VHEWASAVEPLGNAVALDPQFTAAWKLYARALQETGRPREALAAYRTGIDVAQRKGDRQAEKEMTVFARRIERALAES
jgi:Tfp pilus assembly protein PilF